MILYPSPFHWICCLIHHTKDHCGWGSLPSTLLSILICMPAMCCIAYRILFLPGISDLPHYYHWAVPKLKRTFFLQITPTKPNHFTAIFRDRELSHRLIAAKNLWCWPLILGTTVACCSNTQKETACGQCRTVGSMWFARQHKESMAKADRKGRGCYKPL